MKTVAERVKTLETLEGELAASAFSKALMDRSPTVRALAVELISENQTPGMLPEVLPLLNDRDSEVRALAIECTASMADENFPLKIVVRLLSDKDEFVRIAAAEALAKHGNESILKDLYNSLNDKSPLVRGYIAESIGAIGNKESIAILEKRLLLEKNGRARIGYYVGLAALDGRDVFQNLVDLFRSDDYRVRSAVINSLDQIGLKKKDIDRAGSFLNSSLKHEKTIAVQSSIEEALKAFLPSLAS